MAFEAITHEPILVIGGTGTTGRRVADRLRARGHRVRVASRSADWRFDWQDRGTWDCALAGAGSAYVVQYDLEPLTPALVERAAAHGLKRIVLLSARGTDDPDHMPDLAGHGGEPPHLQGEKAVQASGLEWTVVRPGWFAQNFSEGLFAAGVRTGQLRLPTGSAAVSWLDAGDIADVAVAALTADGHQARTYELSGPRSLTVAEAAAEISAALGRTVAYTPVSAEEFIAEQQAQGVPAGAARAVAALLSPIARGKDAYLSGGVGEALGRAPRDFAEFVKDTRASGAWDRAD